MIRSGDHWETQEYPYHLLDLFLLCSPDPGDRGLYLQRGVHGHVLPAHRRDERYRTDHLSHGYGTALVLKVIDILDAHLIDIIRREDLIAAQSKIMYPRIDGRVCLCRDMPVLQHLKSALPLRDHPPAQIRQTGVDTEYRHLYFIWIEVIRYIEVRGDRLDIIDILEFVDEPESLGGLLVLKTDHSI